MHLELQKYDPKIHGPLFVRQWVKTEKKDKWYYKLWRKMFKNA